MLRQVSMTKPSKIPSHTWQVIFSSASCEGSGAEPPAAGADMTLLSREREEGRREKRIEGGRRAC
jgi:hypothetical protein